MEKVVIAKKSRIDHFSISDETNDKKKIVLVDLDDARTSFEGMERKYTFIPASLINNVKGENVQVYHELELFPFFQTAKEIILEDVELKGVFRFRRVLDESFHEAIIISDLCVISSIFGEPVRSSFQISKKEIHPVHVNIMLQFPSGAMAHIDYTFSNEDYIELEWSGRKKIIEFNSNAMKPLEPIDFYMEPLQFSIDSIFQHAKSWHLIQNSFQKYQLLLEGGVKE